MDVRQTTEEEIAPPGGVALQQAQSLGAIPSSAFFDGSPVPTFAIDAHHVVTHWNKACAQALGVSAETMIGSKNLGQVFYGHQRPVLADLIVAGALDVTILGYYKNNKFTRSAFIPDGYEAEHFFPRMGEHGRWLFFTAAPLRDGQGRVIGAIETLQDITTRKVAEAALLDAQAELEELVEKRTMQLAEANRNLLDDIVQREQAECQLQRRNAELTELNARLSIAQEHLIESEKLASIGQLAAGVAHEINNPIGYIFSNFSTLENYLASLFEMLAAHEAAQEAIGSSEIKEHLKALCGRIELDFLKEDIPALMRESKEGIVRVRKIVQDLKDFSRVDANQEWQWSNLHQGIDSTLNIVNNEIKYKADVVKEYGDIPEIECLPSQINQVVMNLIVNAAHAIGPERGKITIRTGVDGREVWFEVADTGMGIPKENLKRIFDPFYTTKPIGKGTGLGLSLSYGLVQKHQGRIDVATEVGKGSCFRVTLPIAHPVQADLSAAP
jgi:signal transduction histidine kinase